MREYKILVFPCGTEVGNEVINSLRNHKYFKTCFASSEGKSFCSFRNQEINILPFVSNYLFLEEINQLIKEENIDFIIPAHDDVAFELSANSKNINCKIIGQSERINKIVRFKDKTYEFFQDKLPLAKIFKDIPREKEFPVFVKPIRGQGSANALSLNNLDSFENFFKEHDLNEFIVMEDLVGEEFTIDCFSDKGKLLYFGARTRDKMTRGIAVLTSLVTDKLLNSEFLKFSKIISTEMGMHGVWFFQMKFDSQRKLKLLEVGPRVPGSMMLNRARGVNFIELALYQALDYDVDVIYNNIDISVGRALIPKYIHNMSYTSLYIDFDDTLYLDENRINSELLKLIFDAKNHKKKVILITKNTKNNLTTVLHKYGICNIFDEIIHLTTADKKIDYMDSKSLLIDDSFVERKEAIEYGHFSIGIDLLDIVY